jgi:thyrotropin-releasing hormone receptor
MANESFGVGTDDGVMGTIAPWFMNSTDTLAGNMSNNASDPIYPSYYSMPYRVAGCLFVSIIFIIGFVGNVMVVIVVSRTQSMHTPTNCYLVSLAIADIMLLVSAPLPTIAEFFLIINQSLLGGVGCAIMVFCQYLGVNVSSLSITAFTVERYIAICHPMRAQTMCTVRRAKRIIGALWAFGICYCVPWLALISTTTRIYSDGTEVESCEFKLERSSYLTYYMADLVIFYIIPLLLTCVLYGLIGRILFTNTIPSTPGKASNGVHSGKKSPSSSRVQVRLRGVQYSWGILIKKNNNQNSIIR